MLGYDRGDLHTVVCGQKPHSPLSPYAQTCSARRGSRDNHLVRGTCGGTWRRGHASYIGLLDKSLDELQAAVALDPRNPAALYGIPRVHLYQQQYARALAEFERRGRAPDWQRALTLEYLGRTSEASDLIHKLEKDYPLQEDVAATYAVLLAAGGDQKRAEEKIRLAIEVGQGRLHFHHAEYNIASAYALMGKNRLALQWLQKTAADGLPCYPLFEKDPHLDSLRGDPGFVTFMDKMKSQWERYKATL